LDVEEVFERDSEREAEQVYRTTDQEHPGVAALRAEGDRCLAGPVRVLALPEHPPEFEPYILPPASSRAAFAEHGWTTVVGFQTRNPIHRAHEYMPKCGLEVVDGLLLHPLVGKTKSDDIPAAVRMRCYELLLERYYPQDRVVLSVYPAAMRYGGPREAIFHAIARKNYGCTHFIVGRDHAGVCGQRHTGARDCGLRGRCSSAGSGWYPPAASLVARCARSRIPWAPPA